MDEHKRKNWKIALALIFWFLFAAVILTFTKYDEITKARKYTVNKIYSPNNKKFLPLIQKRSEQIHLLKFQEKLSFVKMY